MRRLLLFAGYFATASAAVRLTDIYGGELHMRHFQSRMVKDARETGVIVLTLDQKIWNFALVGENPETCGRDCGGAYTRAGAAGQVLHPPGVEGMRFNKIPYEDLPHPHRKLSKKWADRAFALHQWSMHQGKPEQRINRVKELGYLFVEERPPAACDRLPH